MKTGLITLLLIVPLWGQRVPKAASNIATPLSQRQAIINAGLNGLGDNLFEAEMEPVDETADTYRLLGLTGKLIRIYRRPYRIPAVTVRHFFRHKILIVTPSACRLTGVGASVELVSR